MMKTKRISWLAPLVMLLCTAGCPVDINEGDGGGDDGPTEPECPTAQLATVRIFHGAGGTPVTRPDFGPATTRNLTVVRPDLDAEDPPVVASLVAGRAATAQICGNKEVTLGVRLLGAEKDRATLKITLTPDADPSKLDVGMTIVLAGISDENGENPASAANPLQIIVVPETFSATAEAQVQVVHVSRLTPTPIDVEINPDNPGAEITALERYKVSPVVQTKGSAYDAPVAVPAAFLQGTTTKKSFSIARVPTGAKVLAIHFDNEIYDPTSPDPVPAPTARLFLTGDDPLLGRSANGGVTLQ
jgi:hypothetical protein